MLYSTLSAGTNKAWWGSSIPEADGDAAAVGFRWFVYTGL